MPFMRALRAALRAPDMSGFLPKMTVREARLILASASRPTRAEVGAAHKRMLMQNHPDRGGSPYLASKINEAKELLLRR
jgi:DnaJ homolog subfamily C member 19